MNRLMTATFAALLLCVLLGAPTQSSAQAQGATQAASKPPTGPPTGPLAIPNPHYVSIEMEMDVDRPAAAVWKRVGKYCDIGEWFQIPCTILSGTEGQLGEVRSIGNEVLVGKTELSYTYTQPVREGQPYNLYHGTLEARPVTATTSKLVYTLIYDNSMIPEDARDAEIARRKTLFMNGLKNMKTLAEGGTLPPRQAPAAGPR
jgi:hypothetical protein